jgi:hypothetical protein
MSNENFGLQIRSASRGFACLRDLAAPSKRGVRGEMGGMLISGHSGQDALYGRPR